MSDLDARLLHAHHEGDTLQLVSLYQQAAAQTTDPTAAGFYLTHAYVFALEAGHTDVDTLREALIAMGRETAS